MMTSKDATKHRKKEILTQVLTKNPPKRRLLTEREFLGMKKMQNRPATFPKSEKHKKKFRCQPPTPRREGGCPAVVNAKSKELDLAKYGKLKANGPGQIERDSRESSRPQVGDGKRSRICRNCPSPYLLTIPGSAPCVTLCRFSGGHALPFRCDSHEA